MEADMRKILVIVLLVCLLLLPQRFKPNSTKQEIGIAFDSLLLKRLAAMLWSSNV
jgi:uncharacterized protein with PQ loop repeat